MSGLERRNHGRGHSYWIDGTKVPGVTTVLGKGIPKPAFAAADVKKAARFAIDNWTVLDELPPTERLERIIAAPRALLAAAGIRGTNVHQFAQRLQAGEEVQVPDDVDGYVRAYLRFTEDWQPHEILVERPFFHRRMMYAGTPDLVADLADGKRWLLDWKTTASGIWPENALQLAAARYAEVALDDQNAELPVAELGIQLCGCVHLRDDTTYELRPCEAGPDAFKAFLHAKQVAQFAGSERDDWIADPLPAPAKKEEP